MNGLEILGLLTGVFPLDKWFPLIDSNEGSEVQLLVKKDSEAEEWITSNTSQFKRAIQVLVANKEGVSRPFCHNIKLNKHEK